MTLFRGHRLITVRLKADLITVRLKPDTTYRRCLDIITEQRARLTAGGNPRMV